ncbi:MAG: hypothetical protein QXF74_04635 [Nitrososphaerota archaeon]
MSKWIKAFIVLMSILLALSIILYLRDYYEAMNKAKEYGEKGDYEEMELMLDFAHSRIRSIFITLGIGLAILGPIIYYYRKSLRKEQPKA